MKLKEFQILQDRARPVSQGKAVPGYYGGICCVTEQLSTASGSKNYRPGYKYFALSVVEIKNTRHPSLMNE